MALASKDFNVVLNDAKNKAVCVVDANAPPAS